MTRQQARRGDHDEHALLQRAADGDEQAVRQLFRSYSAKIYRHVSRVLGPDDSDVEDVVQQVFMAALDGAHHFDGRSAISTWLYGIATRRALDASRARWRRRRWSKLAKFVGAGIAGGTSEPERIVSARSEAEALLARLTPDQRTVFLLHDVEGHTFAEISNVTGIGISTLHGRLKAARTRLDKLVTGGAGEQ
jgi:RNA polymerase sigma-70 factor (ECF subfamily)